MKGSREGKVDGSKVAGLALFPRLHISDTKKAGPRGPPRNKMALYEQLTVPRKYTPSLVPIPSSARATSYPAMTTPICQPQVHASSFDSRYSYMPMSYMSTMVPTMGYVPMMNVGAYGVGVGATVTSSMNGSSARSTVVDGSAESQGVPWGGETLSRQNSDSGQSRRTAPSKKMKEDDDFAVPTYSSATQASSQSRPLATHFQDRQGFIGGRAAEKGKELAMGKRYSSCVNQSQHPRKEMSMDDDSCTSASMECETVSTSMECETVSTSMECDTVSTSMDCETVSAVDDDVNTLEIGYRKISVFTRDFDSSQMELNTSEIGQERVRVKDQKIVADRCGEGFNKQSTPTTPIAVPPELLHERDSLRTVPEQDIFSSQSSGNRSGAVSEPSQRRRGSSAETDSSTGSICFRDVVDAFGQAEFWKAQSSIIRQQKIFSKQVFELHRVIKVQQLLAKTSSLSLNFEEVLEEVEAEKEEEQEADNVAMPASPVADVPEVPEACPESVNLNPSSDENSRPVPEALPSQPVYHLSVPGYQQSVNPGGFTWPASPYDANPWGARMSSQPLMYASYPGPCPPAHGAYPYMGASMAMYGNSGGTPDARFPTWRQPVMRQPCGSVESVAAAAAAAAWRSEQVVPPAGPLPHAGVVPQTSLIPERQNFVNRERHTSAADQSTQDARQSGEPAKDIGRGQVWGSVDKHVAGPSAPGSDHRRGGDDDRGYGVGHSSDSNRDQAGEVAASGSESESIWQQNRAAWKRARPEPVPWLQTMSPAKRLMQQAPNGVIKVLPRALAASPDSAASILLSLQKERQRLQGAALDLLL